MALAEPAWSRHTRGVAAGFAPTDLTAEHTLVRAWRRRWSAAPGAPALHDPHRGWIDNATLERESAGIAHMLAARGIKAGDRVLLSGASSISLASIHIALLRMAAVVVPVNGAYREREVAHIAVDSRPSLAISDQPDWSNWINNIPVLSLVEAAAAAGSSAASRPTTIELDAAGSAAPALIGYTSGTTGAPKGAVLSHANLLASVAALAIAWRWRATDRLVLTLPLFHAHGLCVGLHGSLYCGASAVLLDGFDPEAVLDAAHDTQATMFFGVPTMYRRLLASPRVGELAALRLCVSGSAPLPATTHAELAAAAGQQVLERYGMTETVMLVSNPFDGERRAGSAGLPLPGVSLALGVDDEIRTWAEAAGTGAVGEILVQGPNVFRGYWERVDANRSSFADGWFRTGDLGTISSDGYVTIVGRAKELIISGGYNVYPREVEDVVSTHPALGECAVVGVPSPEWGEEVTAFAVPVAGVTTPTLDELREHCRASLANYKLPRRLVLVDELPRNALGKVLKHDLVAQLSTPT